MSEDQLKTYHIIRRKALIDSRTQLSQNVSFGDWINQTEIFGEDIRKENPFNRCMDARLIIDQHSMSYDRASYIVLLGRFKQQVSVRNIDCLAPKVKDEEYISKGGFGFIVKEATEGKVKIKKRVFFSEVGENYYCSKREHLENTVREYSYLKLLACYGYGPGLGDNSDEDITCYQDCVTFSMNYCLPFHRSV